MKFGTDPSTPEELPPGYLLIQFSLQGSHPTWKTWNFVIFFSRPGKCLQFAQKVVKTWTFNSMFQAWLFKMSFTKIILIYLFVISTLSTQTLIRSQIDLEFHCFYMEITWKIHGILWYKRSGNPALAYPNTECHLADYIKIWKPSGGLHDLAESQHGSINSHFASILSPKTAEQKYMFPWRKPK